MPDIVTSIEFIADLPLYKNEKPYQVLVSAAEYDSSVTTNNLKFEKRDSVLIRDVREQKEPFDLNEVGFTILNHQTSVSEIKTNEEVAEYRSETQTYLKKLLDVECVYTFDVKLRDNGADLGRVINLRDDTVPDRPAKGAHVDVSRAAGPRIIGHHLPRELMAKYAKRGYRFRIMNTWRSLLPILEDMPLAYCDYRTVDKNDLIACDRVIPTRVGENYYLRYNPAQQWYWLEHMTPEEPVLFVSYDSAPGDQARFCPHVPFPNPRASPTACKRRSVETRSIIISKED
ncbi:hypothetical protein EJ05DRAFT_509607 [Pseudovirgaria hyperparasitica]|uniref:Methyltransferase n=1 Tax=Pseudovirgaria hyperparasitica TaxID=470096 RepID=A0A6A6WFN1_9PEZI|nr:uncharacterized protein EJ05DRAFT_509607 [Pseudovirgaria hyperparasitica]KAF2759931.1 hypothetical protein EJ05DRAFT_509607 [Pseudovirgaria hyperparasitica]